MNRFKIMAEIFYAGSDKLPKAMAAAEAMDNRLFGGYRDTGASDIYFDTTNFNAYFSYEKLSILPGYIAKDKLYRAAL